MRLFCELLRFRKEAVRIRGLRVKRGLWNSDGLSSIDFCQRAFCFGNGSNFKHGDSLVEAVVNLVAASVEKKKHVEHENFGNRTLLEDTCDILAADVKELKDLLSLAREEKDYAFASECEERLASFWSDSEERVLDAALLDSHVASDCFMEIQSGEGGTDAMDWCRMLGDMYCSWADSHGLDWELIEASHGQTVGYTHMTLNFSGASAYGLLAPEVGTHRLIRQSPFDRKGRRHTSFAAVLVLADYEHLSHQADDSEIPRHELRVETMRSSGPGGQSVNKSETAVRMTHLPTGVTVRCQKVASQIENMKTAMSLLRAKLRSRDEMLKRQEHAKLYAKALDASAAAEKRIRTYTLHPREIVKDHRLGLTSQNAGEVLSGRDLTPFLEQGALWTTMQHWREQ